MSRFVSSTRRRAGPILLVDDYADARSSVREALEEAGHSVVEAADGQQALNFLVSRPEERPAVIILDLQMPVMDGWTFLELLKRYVKLATIPVIIVTAQEPRLERLTHHAVFGCLRAPYELSRLLEMVSACIDPEERSTSTR
jgi:CheY-like chemotaxis protein